MAKNLQWIRESLDLDQLIHIHVRTPEVIGITKQDHEQTENKDVFAPLPETFSISLGNEVNQTWDFWKLKNQLAFGSTTLGTNLNRGISERQFWSEITPQDYTVDLKFVAYRSAIADVVHPTQFLLQMSAAKEATLTSSNPRDSSIEIDEFWKRPPKVNVFFGNTIKLTDALIKSCTVTYTNQLDSDGFPMEATASVTFITENPIGYGTLTDMYQSSRGYNGYD